ncbi:uncharacterized protein LOC100900798 [Galendromus occidentalis]|uniref:Uncharacterized protein LOC100900798 n=1 Tax=Galendromus occidentalis TaxID=34638 RepID=A0AAJ6QYR4_9ACAR|nr:uncharacterized protein LOC100900798 [Galendromus occidentalis]
MRDSDTKLSLRNCEVSSHSSTRDRMQAGSMCVPTSQAKSLHVAFSEDNEDVGERKKKYLTAKYGAHQMALIKKRLQVEMWMYDQLQHLYASKTDTNSEVEIDLDEVLDMESDLIRKEFLLSKLHGAKKSRQDVENFVKELLTRAKTL